MAFDPNLMKIVSETSLGAVNGWKGNIKVVRYKYGENPESVKIVLEGKTASGESFETKLMSGVPVTVLAQQLLPALAKIVKEELKEARKEKPAEVSVCRSAVQTAQLQPRLPLTTVIVGKREAAPKMDRRRRPRC